MKNLKQFAEDLEKDANLRMKFELMIDEAKDEFVNPDEMKLAIAQSLGYKPDETEQSKLLAGEQELDLDDLDAISGGWCWKDHDCIVIYVRTSRRMSLMESLDSMERGQFYTANPIKTSLD